MNYSTLSWIEPETGVRLERQFSKQELDEIAKLTADSTCESIVKLEDTGGEINFSSDGSQAIIADQAGKEVTIEAKELIAFANSRRA